MDLVRDLARNRCQPRCTAITASRATGVKLALDRGLPVDRQLQRADRSQRLGHRFHQRLLELAAAPPGRIHLEDVVQRAGGDIRRQVVGLGQDGGRLLGIGVEELDALAAGLDDGAQLLGLLGDHLVGRDGDRLRVGRQLLVEPRQDLVLHAGLLLLGVDRLGNDRDVDLVVIERRQAGAEIADRDHLHVGDRHVPRVQRGQRHAFTHRLRPGIDEALALEVGGLVDRLARPRHPEAAAAIGAAAQDLDVEAFLDGAERRRQRHLGEQRVARHHVAHDWCRRPWRSGCR